MLQAGRSRLLRVARGGRRSRGCRPPRGSTAMEAPSTWPPCRPRPPMAATPPSARPLHRCPSDRAPRPSGPPASGLCPRLPEAHLCAAASPADRPRQ
eukprot:15440309-Alexandrium_andersonii.AAC.1